jgi:hypothetical protein
MSGILSTTNAGTKKSYLQKALWAAGKDWNEAKGREVIKALEPDLDRVVNPEILQTYLDLCGDELGHAKLLSLADRIVDLSENPWDRLQYQVLKGTLLIFLGDREAGNSEILTAIHEIEESGDEPKSSHDRLRWADALQLAGSLNDDESMLNRALEVAEGGVQGDDLTPQGRASWHRALGDMKRALADWEGARLEYATALDFAEDPYVVVELARASISTGARSRARDLLHSLDFDSLDPSLQTDHVFIHYGLLVQDPDDPDRQLVEDRLNALSPRFPMHREIRADMLLALSREALAKASDDSARTSLLRAVWEGYLLQPNLFGIGYDLKALINHFTQRRQAKVRQDESPGEPGT